jgi:hypothetical protein
LSVLKIYVICVTTGNSSSYSIFFANIPDITLFSGLTEKLLQKDIYTEKYKEICKNTVSLRKNVISGIFGILYTKTQKCI